MTCGNTLGLHNSNICIPFICPLIQLLEVQSATEVSECTDWDFAFDVIMAHLDGGRVIARQTAVYRSNAETYLGGGQAYQEEFLHLFTTEMHLKLLFGSRGADAEQDIRYSKFNLLLTVMSDKLEP